MPSPRSIVRVPSDVSALLSIARVYEKSGRKELARAEYEHTLALNPKYDESKKALDALRN